MPLYEYECQSCHRRLEKIQKFSDPPLEVCPHCAGRLEKMVSSPAFQFKGSGWYVTDYARKSEKPASDGTTKDAKDSTATAEKAEKAEKADKTDKTDKGASDKKDSEESKPAADSKEPPRSST